MAGDFERIELTPRNVEWSTRDWSYMFLSNI
jgi:hypothetical protein